MQQVIVPHSVRLRSILLSQKKSSLPQGVVLQDLSASKHIKTLSDQVMAQQVITLRDIRLPEFDKNGQIAQQKVLVFDNDNCRYDMILGTNYAQTHRAPTLLGAMFSSR
jgi:hypothetical protein